MNAEKLIEKLVKNLNLLGYDNLASVYNDVLGMEGAMGRPVKVVWKDTADEPDFKEEEKQEPHIQFEYDLTFYGGDYNAVGTFVYVPFSKIQELGYEEAFEAQTGVSRQHLVHYSQDELYTAEGEEYEEE